MNFAHCWNNISYQVVLDRIISLKVSSEGSIANVLIYNLVVRASCSRDM
jgi:hypothetical protein